MNTGAAGKGVSLAGFVTIPEGYPDVKADNKVVWITPDGEVKWRYLKARPVPGAEPIVDGDDIIPVDQTGFGAMASVICFDMDHPAYIRQAGRSGTDVMLVPSNDYPAIVPFHTYMALFRGIENGFSIVRAQVVASPLPSIIRGAPWQRLIISRRSRRWSRTFQPTGSRRLSSVVGDLFAWLSMVGFVTLVGLALVRPTRS